MAEPNQFSDDFREPDILPPIMIPPLQSQPRNLSELLEKSYNSWRYGDEASLYSIAEDSREERTSELASRCGTEFDCGGATGLDPNWNREVKVELQWTSGDEEETHFSESDGVVGLNATVDSTSSGSRRRRTVYFFLVSFVFLVATLLGVLLRPVGGADPTPSKQVDTDVLPDVNHTNSSQTGSNEIMSTNRPVPAPTLSPTAAGNPALLQAFVKSSVEFCSNTSKLDDPTSLQYEGYGHLLNRVRALSSVNSQGYLEIPVSIGSSYVAETYGLIMLYLSTRGAEWSDNEHWVSKDSPCDWYGVGECMQRREGSCQVEGLALSEYQSFGHAIVSRRRPQYSSLNVRFL